MIKREVLSWLKQELSKKYSPLESERIARMLICWKLSCSHTELLLHLEQEIPDNQYEALTTLVHEHLYTNKPLQYSIGSVPFMAATIKVRAPVLIPRPETELMCHYTIEQLKKLNNPRLTLLDLCTGSGCIAIALAQTFRQATIFAIDNASQALALARENSSEQQCPNIEILNSDLFSALPRMKFDAILSNPPYVSHSEWQLLDKGITRWEDPGAFLAGDDGLEILQQIIAQAPAWLTFEKNRTVPQLILECGETHAYNVATLMQTAGFMTQIHKDDAGKDRFVTGILAEEPV